MSKTKYTNYAFITFFRKLSVKDHLPIKPTNSEKLLGSKQTGFTLTYNSDDLYDADGEAPAGSSSGHGVSHSHRHTLISRSCRGLLRASTHLNEINNEQTQYWPHYAYLYNTLVCTHEPWESYDSACIS